MKCRKSFTDLTTDERTLLAEGLNHLNDNGRIAAYASEHEGQWFNIHRGPAFLPWHRHFLLRFEQELQNYDARINLPYWDWSNSDSQDLEDSIWLSFFGGRENNGGLFDDWSLTRRDNADGHILPSNAGILIEQQEISYENYRSANEFGAHVPPHRWIGGTMEDRASPGDPLFFLHHCNIDRLWAIWQRNHPAVIQYTTDGGSSSGYEGSTVDLNSPMAGGATPASMLDHQALGYHYPQDVLLDDDAATEGIAPFDSGDPSTILNNTPVIFFNDIPEGETTKRAVYFSVEGCESLTFTVTNGPTGDYSLYESGPYTYPQNSLDQGDMRIWLMFTGEALASGEINRVATAGVISIQVSDSDGNVIENYQNIPILANTIKRPTVAVAMVLDESGSMLLDAGNNRDTRLAVLRKAATTFVDQVFDDNAIALVSFSNSAQTLMGLQEAGDISSSVRGDARNEITNHGPADFTPLTSIGAGLQEAYDIYQNSSIASDYDIQATLVFTDGIETVDPRISQVSGLIDNRVYAIGVADAATVDSNTLATLADNSGGYMLLEGAIEQDDEFLLEKYFLQMLAGITNRNIVRDPEGWLAPGVIDSVPFTIASSDIDFDAIVLCSSPQFLTIALESPDGKIITEADLPVNSLRRGVTSVGFRVNLPIVVDSIPYWAGDWNLLLAYGHKTKGVTTSDRVSRASTLNRGTPLHYSAIVHSHSNLKMTARIDYASQLPGSEMNLTVNFTEYGQVLETHPKVHAVVTKPNGSKETIYLSEQTIGEYQSSMTGSMAGVYQFHILANGYASRGYPFTREQILTGVIGHSSGDPTGDGTGGGSGSGSGDGSNSDGSETRDIICKLLKCLFSESVLSDDLVKRLLKQGVDLQALRKCLEIACRDKGTDCHKAINAGTAREIGRLLGLKA